MGRSNDDAVSVLVAWCGEMALFLYFLTFVPMMRSIFRSRSVHGYTSLPLVAALGSCVMWVIYSAKYPRGSRQPALIGNCLGLPLNIYFCNMYHRFAPDDEARILRRNLLYSIGAVAVAVLLAFSVPLPDFLGEGSGSTSMLGSAAAIFSTYMYAAPLAGVRSDVMPLEQTIGALLCSATWSAYAAYTSDITIGVPNFCGVVLGFLQLCCF